VTDLLLLDELVVVPLPLLVDVDVDVPLLLLLAVCVLLLELVTMAVALPEEVLDDVDVNDDEAADVVVGVLVEVDDAVLELPVLLDARLCDTAGEADTVRLVLEAEAVGLPVPGAAVVTLLWVIALPVLDS
jgi:hypothetical protein